jgi:hypothetical protein
MLIAQAVLEYGGLSSTVSSMGAFMGDLFENLFDHIQDALTNASASEWLILIAGGLMLWFLFFRRVV